MNFLQNKISGIRQRINSAKYGMFYWSNKEYKIPEILSINGNKKRLKVDNMSIHEFTLICIQDCYHLKYLKRKLNKVKTIADVGANQGMFAIASRQLFPDARIDCYEPNPQLEDILKFNTTQLNATAYFEAVMKEDCKVNLHFTESDLATTARESCEGNVTGSSLATVIKRIGEIDILKLDCEGTEWELLEDIQNWKKIRSLTMEYHLWGMTGAKADDLFKRLDKINFKLLYHTTYNSQQGFVLAVNKSFLK